MSVIVVRTSITFLNLLLVICGNIDSSFGIVELKTQDFTANKSIIIDTKGKPFGYMWLQDTAPTRGLLYPLESESREVRTLDGIWRFLQSDVNDPMKGVRDGWFKADLDKVNSNSSN